MRELKSGLERVPCIWYLVIFKNQIEALLDLKSEINKVNTAFASQLGFKIHKINIGAQRIDSTTFETYEMIVFTSSMSDKDGREKIFEENFVIADIKPNIVVGMHFFTM